MENQLKSNAISLHGLIFQGMGQLSPLFTFDGIISVAAFAEGASPLAFLIGLIASLLTGNTLYQFSKRTASARGYYGYSGYSLGNHAGFITSYLYLIYQLANLIFILSFFIMIFNPAILYLTGVNVPYYYGIILVIAISIPSFYAIYKGIVPSFKSQIIINVVEIIFVVSISIIIIVTSRDNTLSVFTPISGYKNLFLGFITGSFLAYTGYGSIVPLGEEAQAPRKNIGIAIVAMLLIIGVLDLLISYALVVGFGLSNMSSFSDTVIPAFIVIKSHIGLYTSMFFLAFNFFIIYTLFNTIGTAITRNIYSMARDGYLPPAFSKLNKHNAPQNALFLLLGIFIAVGGISTYIFYSSFNVNGFLNQFIFYATISTLATLIIHMIVNSGLSKVHKNFTFDILIPSVSTIIILIALYYAISTLAFPFTYALIIMALYIIIVVVMDLSLKGKMKNINFNSAVDK
ncbi:amino acid permease [Ferroplasma acidiphilum]|uniref:Amino acid permease n=2 Tax=Ferroplasma acidiphilum TaxID=74969 RepID=A0A1V0N2Z8_9ARCH|nr:APC family permease [Ferroplasma acidiphilum]ARD84523.1 amino acid permease [Ferroplasma acidiphilum]WMT53455.1 MAG: APC family permease [Ferroplasma acidiphilum]